MHKSDHNFHFKSPITTQQKITHLKPRFSKMENFSLFIIFHITDYQPFKKSNWKTFILLITFSLFIL